MSSAISGGTGNGNRYWRSAQGGRESRCLPIRTAQGAWPGILRKGKRFEIVLTRKKTKNYRD